MTILDTLKATLAAHPGLVAWLVACAAAVYRSRTPSQWVALGDSLPRVQGLLKLARGAGFEPVRVLEGAVQTITGRRVPDPRELVIASQRDRIAELERALATYQRDAVAHSFDAGARQVIAPAVVEEAQRLTRESERGSVELGALGYVVALVMFVAALVMGCPRLPPVSGCNPMAQTCIHDRPHVCSASQRWHRAGDLTCAAVGGVCLVTGGRAYCGTAADGGAR